MHILHSSGSSASVASDTSVATVYQNVYFIADRSLRYDEKSLSPSIFCGAS